MDVFVIPSFHNCEYLALWVKFLEVKLSAKVSAQWVYVCMCVVYIVKLPQEMMYEISLPV